MKYICFGVTGLVLIVFAWWMFAYKPATIKEGVFNRDVERHAKACVDRHFYCDSDCARQCMDEALIMWEDRLVPLPLPWSLVILKIFLIMVGDGMFHLLLPIEQWNYLVRDF